VYLTTDLLAWCIVKRLGFCPSTSKCYGDLTAGSLDSNSERLNQELHRSTEDPTAMWKDTVTVYLRETCHDTNYDSLLQVVQTQSSVGPHSIISGSPCLRILSTCRMQQKVTLSCLSTCTGFVFGRPRPVSVSTTSRTLPLRIFILRSVPEHERKRKETSAALPSPFAVRSPVAFTLQKLLLSL
jgi:hypothetical protein